MPHPLVQQLRFARSEFVRGLAEVAGEEARRRFGPMNCISWIVGHLAWQEQRYWLTRAQGQVLLPDLNERLAYGKPACTPDASEMWAAWRTVTHAADPWLDALTPERLAQPLTTGWSSAGTFLLRVIGHYWYHFGEGLAIRQLLGHTNLPDFVGDIDTLAPYQPEPGVTAPPPLAVTGFVAQVLEERARWESLLAGLDDSVLLRPGASGSWSLKDVIAHITWHEKEMLGVLRSRTLAGSDWWDLPLDERNARIHASLKDLPLEQLRGEARQVFDELVGQLKKLEDADLDAPARFKDMPPDWRPRDLLADNTFQHYLDHRVMLQDWLAREMPAQGA